MALAIVHPASTDVPTDMDRIEALRKALREIRTHTNDELAVYKANIALEADDRAAEAQDAAQEAAARPLCGITGGPLDMQGACASCACWERR